MDFGFSPEQRSARDLALGVARNLPLRNRTECERESLFDRSAWNSIADSGLLHGFVPTDWGGKGWSTSARVAALEAFGLVCRDNALALALSSLVWTILPPIISFGTREQIERYLPRILSGDCLAADGITEPNAGSDAMAMETYAEPTEDGYRIRGSKCHIGMAPIADLVLLYAKTDPQAGPWGVTAFLVDADSPNLIRSPNQPRMGLKALPSGTLTFDDCFVPDSARLGEEGAGLSMFNDAAEWERAFILAPQVGAMQRQLDECIGYCNTRKQFGHPISHFQSVSNRIAEMKLRLENCRLQLYRTAWKKDLGETCALEASLTKLCISESFVASSLEAVRLHGANGYLTEFEIERDLRDSVGGLIYAGTSDIQRNLISRLCGVKITKPSQ